MPDIPRFSAFDVTSKLQSELEFNQSVENADPLAGTGASIPSSIRVQTVTQNSSGFWSEVISDQSSPVQSQNSLLGEFEQKRVGIISSFEQICSAYDQEILSLNNQINAKKLAIVNKVTSAIGGGCSAPIPVTASDGAENINGISVGVGATVYGDKASIKIYPNIRDYSASSPFFNPTNQDLSNSNVGTGYENVITINGGSSIGLYRPISTNSAVHCLCTSILQPLPHLCNTFLGDPVTYTTADQETCVGYGNSIITIAAEIVSLRNERDQYLNQINNLKKEKNKKEIINWGNRKSEDTLERYNNALQQAITDLSEYIDPIVMSGLIVYYDAAESYGVGTTVDIYTGITSITTWNNLKGDSLYALPQTSLYPINLDNNDGPSVELNNYSVPTNQYFTIPSSYIATGKIGTGNTSYTIETWVKITGDTNLGISSTTNGANIVGINSFHGYGLQVFKPSGIRVSFGERSSGRLVNNTNLNKNIWYHIVGVNESGVGSKIYVNGTLDGTGSSLNIIASTSNLQIGYAPSINSQYLSGKLSVIRIYNTSLTQAQVLQNYNAHKSRYGY